MFAAARSTRFPTAARLRDDLRRIQAGLAPEVRESLTPAPPRTTTRSTPPSRGRKSRSSFPPPKRKR
ncbi:MAG: hypothetical protein U0263_29975 [Polyangiaceae bacterium]